MKHKLSFYITIKDVTIRLADVSLRTISHIAEHLADINEIDEIEISITSDTLSYSKVVYNEQSFLDQIDLILKENRRD